MPLTLWGFFFLLLFFFFPQIKTLSRISMEWVPQAVDKAEAKHHEADTEGYSRAGRRKKGEKTG